MVGVGVGAAEARGVDGFSVTGSAFFVVCLGDADDLAVRFEAFFLGFGLGDFLAAVFRDFFDFAAELFFGVGAVVSSSSCNSFAFFDSPLVFLSVFGVSVGVGFDFGVGVGDAAFFDPAFCLADFGFGVGRGDCSGEAAVSARATWRVFRNASRFCFSSSLTCARRRVAAIALIAKAVASQSRKRTTLAERNRGGEAFKQPARPEQAELSWPLVPVHGEELH
jgi:hypothetical protein